MKYLFYTLLLSSLLVSCTKEITLDLDNKSGQIVIEGNIIDGAATQTVRITRSVAFTASNQYPAVTNAVVIVRDNAGAVETLTYTTNGEYTTNRIVTAPGRTYSLEVRVDGQVYTATSTLTPRPVPLNGLILDSIAFGGEVTYTLLPVFTDPQPLGDRYFLTSTVSGKQEKIIDVFSDNINNGILNQRIILLAFNNTDEDIKVERGDTVTLELHCVDEKVYTYFNSIIQLYRGGPGGGVTPSNPPSNISNGALGYFSANSRSSRTIVIP
jgi:hypothetical protein